LAMSALKGTDAFGPGSNRIEQLVCRLRRGVIRRAILTP
jgi:hypothetical protein